MVGCPSQLVTILLIMMALGIVEKTFSFIGYVISKDYVFKGLVTILVKACHSKSSYHVQWPEPLWQWRYDVPNLSLGLS